MALIARFLNDAQGATAIEYCLIGGLIAISIVAGASGIGSHLITYFGSVGAGLN